ncbi:MAG TPA: class I SAM-dependent methyltransferase [Jatrophihabitantaceae bacterium]|nr:class I SAM-dependent methyltransferase [Jatrophihabitantaceae bacterium]
MDDLRAAAHEWDRHAWSLAALTLALNPIDHDEQLTRAAAGVLDALGLSDALHAAPPDARGAFASQTSAGLLQTAAIVRGGSTWTDQSDEALIAQGRASAQGVPMFAQFVLPALGGLAERFGAPGARMLDVGTGTAALAIAYAQAFPQLEVVGVDVWPGVLALAGASVAASDVRDRVVLRHEDVGELTETDAYDLVWLPAPFVPEPALHAAVPRLVAALRPGGWIMVGHGRFAGDAVENAVNVFKTVAFGGTPLDAAAAQQLLTTAGLVDVQGLPTPPGAPALTVGRRPAR